MSIYKGRKRKEKINIIRRLTYYLKRLFITQVEYALNEGAKDNVHRFHAKVIPYEPGYRFYVKLRNGDY